MPTRHPGLLKLHSLHGHGDVTSFDRQMPLSFAKVCDPKPNLPGRKHRQCLTRSRKNNGGHLRITGYSRQQRTKGRGRTTGGSSSSILLKQNDGSADFPTIRPVRRIISSDSIHVLSTHKTPHQNPIPIEGPVEASGVRKMRKNHGKPGAKAHMSSGLLLKSFLPVCKLVDTLGLEHSLRTTWLIAPNALWWPSCRI